MVQLPMQVPTPDFTHIVPLPVLCFQPDKASPAVYTDYTDTISIAVCAQQILLDTHLRRQCRNVKKKLESQEINGMFVLSC